MADKRIVMALAAATAIAIPAEGIRRTWYFDPPGIVTVCYGHTGDVDKAKTYSLDECKALLDKDMLHAVSTVDTCRPGLPAPVLAAFADAVYNLGPTIACNPDKSTAARMLRDGNLKSACLQLDRWSYAKLGGVNVRLPGLIKRRAAERDLCLSGT